MSWIKDDYANSILTLGKMSSGLLAVLEVYQEKDKINLTKKDLNNFEYAITFLETAIVGCESKKNPKRLFEFDENFPTTPASALRLTFEIIFERTQNISDIAGIEKSCEDYITILEKVKKRRPITGAASERKLKNTINFFDGLEKKADLEMSQSFYSITSTSTFSNFLRPI